jgi:RHS repeat-associated protein
LDTDLGWNTYQMRWRTMDPQIGRFLQIDPLAPKYVHNSTYAYAENRVINGVDLEGLEWENFMTKFKKPSELKIKPVPSGKNVQNQTYSTTVEGAKKSVGDLYTTFKQRPQELLNNSKAEFQPVDGNGNKLDNANLKVGSNIEVDIDGPMNNSYVRVTDEQTTKNGFSLTFSTLEGHIEAGAITFSVNQGKEGDITFSINSTSKVDQGAASLFKGFARNQQKQSWLEVLDNIGKYFQGKEKDRKVTTNEEKP